GRVTCDGFAALRSLLDSKAPGGSGRWSLLRGPLEKPPDFIEPIARQYLRRYGIVFRDLLAREPRSPPWRELLQVYRRLEARGARSAAADSPRPSPASSSRCRRRSTRCAPCAGCRRRGSGSP